MKHSLYKAQAYSLSSKLFAGGNYMLGCRALAEPVCFFWGEGTLLIGSYKFWVWKAHNLHHPNTKFKR